MKKLIFLQVIIFFAINAGCTQSQPDIDESIDLSINYLKENTLPEGRFVYRRHAKPEIKYKNKKYNALRHAGTLYSMYLCERVLRDSTLRAERLLASAYLKKNYIRPVAGRGYAIVSKPEEEGLQEPVAKLGGTGLALIALSNLRQENFIGLDTLQGMGDFILSMQQPDGNFISKYLPQENRTDTAFYSLYYPGEAALGLLYLYEADKQEKWLNSSKRALLYLANKRKNAGTNVEFDHWAMLATQKLFDTESNGLTQLERKQLQQHAAQMANFVFAKQITDQNHLYVGSLQKNHRPCSIGTIMEGLVAIYAVTEDETLRQQIKQALQAGVDFLMRYQIKEEGITQGGIPTHANWRKQNAPQKSGIIQIDNVQHVLSAWITFGNLR